MRTESGPSLPGSRVQSRFAAAAILAVLALSVPFASGQVAEPGPPWRDADQAAAELAAAQVRLLDARDALVHAESALEELRERQLQHDAKTYAVAEDLQSTEDLARELAVEAYISGGNLTEAIYLLDAATASDFAYRTTIISEGADAVARTTRDYIAKRRQANAAAIALAEEIDEMDRSIELARQEIPKAERALVKAEWVHTVAEIHRAAEELLAASGRPDPTEAQWEELRFCESRDDYQANTGNSFYGAYQFTIATWVGVGGTGLPSDAPAEEQDARARYLYALRGSGYGQGGSWPLCGRYLPDN